MKISAVAPRIGLAVTLGATFLVSAVITPSPPNLVPFLVNLLLPPATALVLSRRFPRPAFYAAALYAAGAAARTLFGPSQDTTLIDQLSIAAWAVFALAPIGKGFSLVANALFSRRAS